ncbi:adenosylcobinamide amidohydrolase [Natrarchaeobaculum sulfurireducens]|uniref:Adenosylcobinamide amidohydrolase n=1 Tax=Natrarchaeobaculum sulfurireducens TaxID=2044521 RepID=A0A346PTA8_9EURY|nr:adenosylcobinamide amidohydrolase [Natrarchaeobaculum sulfurireducens]AXR82753.1 Adenosylcobinamide amidohydrolase [Natrarchaeobaculum sulfurireducens]
MTEPIPDYEACRRDGVLRVRREGTEWLSTGADGGRTRGECAYNVSVPEGWTRTDLAAYVDERLERAGFDVGDADASGERPPALLTGVDIADARGARCGPVMAYATAGVSNPAALPMEPPGGSLPTDLEPATDDDHSTPGTVNVVVGTTHSLPDGALANLIAVTAEAKAATLLETTGFPGTTTDAVVVGHDPDGRSTRFSGSGTAVGAATRACVREAVRASLSAHYEDHDVGCPASVEEATYGVSTDVRATVFEPPTLE